MAIDTISELIKPLDQVRFYNETSSCIVENDPPVTVRRLTLAAHAINSRSVSIYGGRIGQERERGLTESVIASAFQRFGDEEPYPDPFDKAAVLFRGITAGHPFTDGNKRTGFLISTLFLEELGFPIPDSLSVEEAYNLCMQISSGEVRDIQQIRQGLEGLWSRTLPVQNNPQ